MGLVFQLDVCHVHDSFSVRIYVQFFRSLQRRDCNLLDLCRLAISLPGSVSENRSIDICRNYEGPQKDVGHRGQSAFPFGIVHLAPPLA